MEELKELVSYMAKNLVDQPAEVEVTCEEGERTLLVELSVGDGDLGKVIGKEGRTARAMRTILAGASAKERKRAILEILE